MLTRSSARAEPGERGRARLAKSAAAPIGRFRANSQGQLVAERINAPKEGPVAVASATVSAFQPMAAPRR